MGVPSFYKWLVNKYPKVVTNALEERGESLDTSLPNPNGIEFDHLYLDMNGIIHPCFHPEEEDEGISIPSTFGEVFNNIFQYIDRLFSIVRPRKLLYMAIDGVAPRAKMNQQRSRRFRTAKDKEEAENEEMRLRKEFEREGKLVLPKEESQVSDSNIISPGTEFMDKLSKALKKYIKSRLSSDLGWRDIKVILSDANVPGEGEHKIMSFIRQQRTLRSYNPNTRHCLYGLDADLIMLALATHEIHFSILREDILVQDQCHSVLNCNPSIKASLSERESSLVQSSGLFDSVSESETKHASLAKKKPYQFLHVWILREYLEMDMQISDPPENFKFDIERIVDDFVFMCFFVGNDFLPHTPSLAIHEGSIDLLMTVYKKELKKIGGYLLDMIRVNDRKEGYMKSSRVEKFILSIGSFEEKIFEKRSLLRDRTLRKHCSAVEEDDTGSCRIMNGAESDSELPDEEAQSKDLAISLLENISSDQDMTVKYSEMLKNTKELKRKVKDNLRKQSDLFKNGSFGIDKVRLGSPGYKERYYKHKFGAENPGERESTRKKVVEKYTEGLHWVLLCYFAGPPSWTWFYPFHYGPFVSDLKGLSQVKVRFQEGSPLKPFDQLLAVLPPRSVSALPNAYHGLMKEASALIDFYPTDFEIDMDGKRFSWQGVSKLPFIDETRLLSETRLLEKDLEVGERERNIEKLDQLLLRCTHKLGSKVVSLSAECNTGKGKYTLCDDDIGGSVCIHHEYMTMDKEEVYKISQDDYVLCLLYEPPQCGQHIPRLLDGVQSPEKTIREDDVGETQLWHEKFRQLSISKDSPIDSNKPIHNHAGSGWKFGRGRGRTNSANCESPIPRLSRRASFSCNISDYNNSYYDHPSMHVGAGFGWGASRGKPNSSINSSQAVIGSGNPNYAAANFTCYDHQSMPIDAGSVWGPGRGKPNGNVNCNRGVFGSGYPNYAAGSHTSYDHHSRHVDASSNQVVIGLGNPNYAADGYIYYDHQSMRRGAGSVWGVGRGEPSVTINSCQGVIHSGNPNYDTASYTAYDHQSMHRGAGSVQGAGGGEPNITVNSCHGVTHSGNPNYDTASYTAYDHQSMHRGTGSVWGAGRGEPNITNYSGQGLVHSGNPNCDTDSYTSYDHQSMHTAAGSVCVAGMAIPSSNVNCSQGVIHSGNPYYTSASCHRTFDANQGRGNYFIRPGGRVGRANGSFWPSRNSGFTGAWRQTSQRDDGKFW